MDGSSGSIITPWTRSLCNEKRPEVLRTQGSGDLYLALLMGQRHGMSSHPMVQTLESSLKYYYLTPKHKYIPIVVGCVSDLTPCGVIIPTLGRKYLDM